MDRIIPRQDPAGKEIIFCADTLTNSNIMALYNGSEPFLASLDFYKNCRVLPENKQNAVAKAYAKNWNQEVQVMHRLPRVLRNAPNFHANKARQEQEPAKEQPKLTLLPAPTEAKRGYLLVRKGEFWAVTEAGKVIAYAIDEATGLDAMREMSGMNQQTH